MIGRAQSDTQKNQNYATTKEKWMLQAVEAFGAEQADKENTTTKPKSA